MYQICNAFETQYFDREGQNAQKAITFSMTLQSVEDHLKNCKRAELLMRPLCRADVKLAGMETLLESTNKARSNRVLVRTPSHWVDVTEASVEELVKLSRDYYPEQIAPPQMSNESAFAVGAALGALLSAACRR